MADLDHAELIVHSADRRSTMHRRVTNLFERAGVTPTVRYEVGETSTLATLVAGGLGVALVPEPLTALRLDGLTYRPLADDVAALELAVAHRRGRTEAHLLRTVDVVTRLVEAPARGERGPST